MAALPSACRQVACSSSRKAARIPPACRAACTTTTCVGIATVRKGSGACGRYSHVVTCRRAAALVAATPTGKNPAGAAARRGSTTYGCYLAGRTTRGGGGAHRGAHPWRLRRPRGCLAAGAMPPTGMPPAGEGSDLALRRTARSW
ncbi:hypothetical protein C4D60_Mb08t15410 [Musa balbisiana]|uniref:Uncharacterized protein n=1 Tax=Musa balbisiana TaxID=52838 RepID=A0A4S8K402_MUSBA|nr:hypothetical protein C4D60_Mb08t15410 [Musa balbisiana]